MKKISGLIVGLLIAFSVNAQTNSVVKLKNGSVLKGEILKDDDTGVQLRTRDGSVWNFTKEEVASTEKFSPTVSPNGPQCGRKGFYNRSTIGVMGGDNFSPSLQIVNGYSFNSHWETGFGIGLEQFFWNPYLPIFLEGRYTLLNKTTSPYISINAGYEMPMRNFNMNKGGFTAGIQLGITHYFSNHVGISTSAGYRFTQLKEINMWWDDFETIRQLNRFEVRVGLVFR